MATTADLYFFGNFLIFFVVFKSSEATKFCLEGYYCERGHCCGHGRCCTYYYELWWFWVACILLALIGTCWYLHHRTWKKRLRDAARSRENETDQEQTTAEPEAQTYSKIFQLPPYEEVQVWPKEPPPYHNRQHVQAAYFQNTACASHTTIPSPPLYNPGSRESVAAPPQYSAEDTSLLLEPSQGDRIQRIQAAPSSSGDGASASLVNNEQRHEN